MMRTFLSICILTILLASFAPAQEPTPEQLLAAAIDAQQHGDYPTAIRDYRKVLELRPGAVEAKVNLGVCLEHGGDFEGAIAAYQAVLIVLAQKNDLRQNDVRRNLALVYLQKRDL